MEKISEMLFEALTSGGSLKELQVAMKEYETKYPGSLRNALRGQPAFRKMWTAMAEACEYEFQMGA